MRVLNDFFKKNNLKVADLVNHDELHVPSEEAVFAAVMRWVKHDAEARKEQVRFDRKINYEVLMSDIPFAFDLVFPP